MFSFVHLYSMLLDLCTSKAFWFFLCINQMCLLCWFFYLQVKEPI